MITPTQHNLYMSQTTYNITTFNDSCKVGFGLSQNMGKPAKRAYSSCKQLLFLLKEALLKPTK